MFLHRIDSALSAPLSMSNIVLQQPCNWRCLRVNMQRMYKATCGISGNTMHAAVKTKTQNHNSRYFDAKNPPRKTM